MRSPSISSGSDQSIRLIAFSLQLQPLQNRLPCRQRSEGSAEVVRRFVRVDGGDYGVLDERRLGGVAEVFEHHRGGEDCADWIGYILPRVLRRGAVDWLEERNATGVDVAGGGHPQTALERGA